MIFYYYLLLLKTYFNIIYKKLRYNLNFKKITIVDSQTKELRNVTIKYNMIKMINYIINFFEMMRNKIDVKADKIHITKQLKYKSHFGILMAKDNSITLDHVNKHYDKMNIEISLPKIILMKFEIELPNNEKKCLKEYFFKYYDESKLYDNTIDNIMVFNKMNIAKDSKLNIKIFTDGKIEELCIMYDQYKNHHVSDLLAIKNEKDI